MTTTSARDDQLVAPPGRASTTGGVSPPPKLRRRPSMMAAGVVAICLGALLAVWAWTSTTSTVEVIAARDTIHRGDVIEADDLQRIRINDAAGLDALPASGFDDIVGQRAALDIAGGSLLTASSTSEALIPPSGHSVVGIALAPGQVPAVPLQSGDQVRIVVTPGQDGEPEASAPAFTSAIVVSTDLDEATGSTVLDVQVPHAEASVLASRVATGRVAVVLDSGER